MTDRECRANAEGSNIVSGATLGFVLAASETLATLPFVTVLGGLIGIVVSMMRSSAPIGTEGIATALTLRSGAVLSCRAFGMHPHALASQSLPKTTPREPRRRPCRSDSAT